MTRNASASALLLSLLMVSAPAFAQSYGGGSGPYQGGAGGSGFSGRSPTPAKQSDDDDPKKSEKPVPPPAAIPGAQPDDDATVVPADKLAAEMSPNDALFDAITRGDLAAAKDALNRGAQLEAHNVLGQTPTDAAIDLSRNDITFLLLSMRGSVSNARGTHVVASEPAPSAHKGGKTTLVKAERKTQTAQLSSDRGTPNPAVGFTGF